MIPCKQRAARIDAEGVALPGDLAVPDDAVGAVVFAHGSGSSRLSPRNRQVSRALNDAGLATLLFDLLTPAESGDRANVFDIELLARRLIAATSWLDGQPESPLPRGYFGASTGAAAALWAAAERPDRIGAIVSRGGRPDLAGRWLPQVTVPTLLIVGGADPEVIDMNRTARARMRSETELVVVPGAGHLFEEPGALEEVSRLAAEWLTGHLKA